MIKFLKKHIIYVAFVVVVLGIIFVSNSLRSVSDTSAKYLSRADATDTARVAKWNITKDGIHNGAHLDLTAVFGKQLKSNTSGLWVLEVDNKSEVSAKLNTLTSNISMRLDRESFTRLSPATIRWDSFSSELLLSFTIDVYNIKYEDLVDGYKRIDGTGSTITQAQFDELTEENKELYIENITASDSDKIAVYSTTLTQTFTLKNALENGKLVYYYESDISLAPLASEIMNMTTNTAFTFVLKWNVGNLGGLDQQAENTKFTIYDVSYTGSTPSGLTERNNISYFDYTTYLSSIGGSASFKFDGSYVGSTYSVFYEYLTATQREQIEGYAAYETEINNNNYEHADKYAEYKLLLEYEKYLNEAQAIYAEQNYGGLNVSFNFDLKVEQVD